MKSHKINDVENQDLNDIQMKNYILRSLKVTSVNQSNFMNLKFF